MRVPGGDFAAAQKQQWVKLGYGSGSDVKEEEEMNGGGKKRGGRREGTEVEYKDWK